MSSKVQYYTKTITHFVEIKVKSCGRPSCAKESQCYRTFATCGYEGEDKLKFYDSATEGTTLKSTTSYYFTDIDNPVVDNNVMPYLEKVKILPTELRDDRVINARANLVLTDDLNPNEKGSFWKKFIARNPYYKGSIISIKHGTAEDNFSTANTVFSGIIEEVSLDNFKVQIKCIDLLAKLNEVKLPLKNRYSLVEKMPKVFQVDSLSEMQELSLFPGELALAKYYSSFNVYVEAEGNIGGGLQDLYTNEEGGGDTGPGNFEKVVNDFDTDNNIQLTYTIIGYDKFDRPCCAHKSIQSLNTNFDSLKFEWPKNKHMKEYKVFRKSGNKMFYLETVTTSDDKCVFIDNNGYQLKYVDFPYEAERYYKFTGGNAKKTENWQELHNEESIFETRISYLKDYRNKILGDEHNPSLPQPGYLKINKEILKYASYTKENETFTLKNVKRMLFDSEAGRYEKQEFVKLLFHSEPEKPGKILLDLLTMAEILDSASTYVDKDSFLQLDTEWQSKIDAKKAIKFSSSPVIDETSAAELFSSLVKLIDAFCWITEEGKITIKLRKEAKEIENSPLEINKIIDDSSDIIINSSKISGGEKDVVTRYSFFWNRIKVKEDMFDKESYKHWEFQVNTDAESEYMYDEVYSREFYAPWINYNCADDLKDIRTYVYEHLDKLLKRYENYRPSLHFSVDIKDYDIKTGDYVIINTDEFNTADGSNFGEDGQNKIFVITKRTLNGNKLNLSARYCPFYDDVKNIEINDESEEYDTNIELYDFAKEVGVSGIKIHNFTTDLFFDRLFIDEEYHKNGAYQLPFNKLVIEWDNMFASTKTTAKYIDEFEEFEIPDPTIWKRIDKYHIYMHKISDRVVRIKEHSYSNKSKYERPNLREDEGEWIKIATIDDKHIERAGYKYTYTVNRLDPGTHVSFFVSASTKKQLYNNVAQED